MADAPRKVCRAPGAESGCGDLEAAGRQACGNRSAGVRAAEERPGLGHGHHDLEADPVALWKLATWLSPAYPVGAFAYSHGLETVIAAGNIADTAGAAAWIADCVEHGAGRTDAILLTKAWRAEAAGDAAALEELADLAAAVASSAERLLETEAQGSAFAAVTGDAWESLLQPAAYPVVIGQAAARHGVPPGPTVLMFLHGFASTLVSACVRLAPLGQTDGQRALAGLMPLCRRIANEALEASLEDIGSCAFRAEIAAMQHETHSVRLFRT